MTSLPLNLIPFYSASSFYTLGNRGSEKRNDFPNSPRVRPEPELGKTLLFVPGKKGEGNTGWENGSLCLLSSFWKQLLSKNSPTPLLISWKVISNSEAASGREGAGGWSKHYRILEKEVVFSFLPIRTTSGEEPLPINNWPLFRCTAFLWLFIKHFRIHDLNWSNFHCLWKWSWRHHYSHFVVRKVRSTETAGLL